MRRLIFISCVFSFFIFYPLHSFSQQGWYQLNSGTSQSFSGIYFTSGDTGYVSGQNGRIMKTTNGGINWINQISGTTNGLASIFFVNSDTGYIVGGGNNVSIILKTTNAGSNWIQQNSGTTNYLLSVYFTDINTGYAVGNYNTKVKTTNGGLNWFAQSGTYIPLSSVYFTDPNTGYVTADEGRIYKTISGGFNWFPLVSNTNLRLIQIVFPNESTGYIAGGGFVFPNLYYTILKTTDSGETWSNQTFPGSELYTIFFNDVNTGYVAGESGKILKTTNGGVNWFSQISSTGSYLNELFFYDFNTGYCVGGYGTILKTTTGGVTSIVNVSNVIPREFKLHQNYPNPFNPSTIIQFDIARKSDVNLSVYDLSGRKINEFVSKVLDPGLYNFSFNGENYASGVYLYVLQADNYTFTRKMILLK